MPSRGKKPPVTHPVEIDLGAGVSLMTTIDPETGVHWVQCDFCRDKIKLTTKGNAHNLLRHRAACITTGVHSAFDTPSPLAPSLSSTSHLFTPSTINGSGTVTPLPMTPKETSWLSMECLDQNSSSMTLSISSSNSVTGQTQCPGFVPEVESVWDGYAYGAHKNHDLGWLPVGFTDREQIILRADHCTRKAGKRKEPCSECLKVLNSDGFKQFLDCSQKEPQDFPTDQLTAAQTSGIIRKQAKDLKRLRTTVSYFCSIST